MYGKTYSNIKIIVTLLITPFVSTLFSNNQKLKDWNYLISFQIKDITSKKLAKKSIKKITQSNWPENIKVIIQKNKTYKNSSKIFVLKKGGKNKVDIKNNQKNENNLYDFLKWSIENSNAKRNALIIWDKISCKNNSGFTPCQIFRLNPTTKMLEIDRKKIEKEKIQIEESFKKYCIDLNLKETLKKIYNENLKKKIDIVGFDAGPCSSIEIASEIKNYAKYMVASEEILPAHGWNHARILKRLNKQNTSEESLARSMVKSLETEYKNHYSDYAQNAVNLEVYEEVENIIKIVVKILRSLPDNSLIIKKIKRERINKKTMIESSGKTQIDLVSLIISLAKIFKKIDQKTFIELLGLTTKTLDTINKYILERVSGKCCKDTHGVYIYFPQKNKHINGYNKLNFAQKLEWDILLKERLNKETNKR